MAVVKRAIAVRNFHFARKSPVIKSVGQMERAFITAVVAPAAVRKMTRRNVSRIVHCQGIRSASRQTRFSSKWQASSTYPTLDQKIALAR